MANYEDAILDFFKKQQDDTKCEYICKVAEKILDFREIFIIMKDGREFYWPNDEEEE